MRANDRIRLHHMLEAAEKAVNFSADKTRADLDTDQVLVLALVKCVEIIGEAANKVTEDSRHASSFDPWVLRYQSRYCLDNHRQRAA